MKLRLQYEKQKYLKKNNMKSKDKYLEDIVKDCATRFVKHHPERITSQSSSLKAYCCGWYDALRLKEKYKDSFTPKELIESVYNTINF